MADGVPAVGLTALRKTFGHGDGAVHAVDGVSLEVADGEFFSLLGPSGSGKTTILRLVAGFELPTSGTVELGGRDVTRLPPFRRDVNTVFQDYALFPHLTVLGNVEYGLRAKGVAKAEARRRAEEALGTVQLADLGGRAPGQLSGGQRQRVALARALVNRPRVLLLDEPLGALDLKLREQMQVELKAIQRDVGITFVVVTHDQDEALTMSDRVAVVDAGRVQQIGTPGEVYERPATPFVAGFVGTSNLLRSTDGLALMAQEAAFSIRPEKIRIAAVEDGAGAPEPGDDEVAADGTVREVVYAGPSTRYLVGLDAGPQLLVRAQNGASPTESAALHGRRVRLTWARRHAVRMPDDTGRAEQH